MIKKIKKDFKNIKKYQRFRGLKVDLILFDPGFIELIPFF